MARRDYIYATPKLQTLIGTIGLKTGTIDFKAFKLTNTVQRRDARLTATHQKKAKLFTHYSVKHIFSSMLISLFIKDAKVSYNLCYMRYVPVVNS